MKLPLFPDGVKTFIRLWPALRIVYEAMEYGTQKAVEYFDNEAGPINAYLAASLVRWNARRFIESKAGDIAISLEEIANIGLRISYADHSIWILKDDDGELPVPKSQVKEEFYEQVLPLLSEEKDGFVSRPNVVVIWGASKDYKVLSLKLTCPKTSDVSKANIQSYWKERIPHPAELINFQMPADADAATPQELTAIEQVLFQKVEGDDK